MTTTVEKILATAQEFEDKARALRLAASLLNGEVREGKAARLEQTLTAATKLRKAHKNGNGGAPAVEADEADDPKSRIRAVLADGTAHASKALATELGITPMGALYHLTRMSDVKKVGKGNATRYQLRK